MDDFYFHDSYDGLQFHSSDTKEFREMFDFLNNKIREAKIENLPTEGERLLKIMGKDVDEFSKLVRLVDSKYNTYYKEPIFKYVDPEKFFKIFMSISPQNRRMVTSSLMERYKYYANELFEEVEWLKNIKKLIKNEIKNRSGEISAYTLELISKNELKDIINKLDKVKKSKSQNKNAKK